MDRCEGALPLLLLWWRSDNSITEPLLGCAISPPAAIRAPGQVSCQVFGGEMAETCEFSSLDEAREILGLLMRHWNTIAGTLFKGEVADPFSGAKMERN
jgi:hypothetical protein